MLSSYLQTPLARRVFRPVADLIDLRIQRSLRPIHKELAKLRGSVAAQHHTEYAVGLLFDGTGRSGPRTPSPAQIDRLVREVARVTGEDATVARRNVIAAFRNVVALEMMAVGRLAGSTSNVCGKLATIPLLAPRDNAEILEIGTLYGLFSATLMRMMHRAGVEPRVTLVDPLAGSQLQPGTKEPEDPTGTPVRPDVLRANLAFGGAAGAEARIVQGFSTDDDVRGRVSDREYGVIVIDGDHSKEGVLADLEWAEKIVAPGGIVVLDDYGDKRWHGVKEASDQHLADGGSRFELLGAAATSAFLRARD